MTNLRYLLIIFRDETSRHDKIAEILNRTGLAASHSAGPIPDLLDRRPSALCANQITLAHYAPPNPVWPDLLLCHWPRAYTQLITPSADMFARGSYTMEILRTAPQIGEQSLMLLETLRAVQDVEVVVVPPSGASISGNA